MGKADLIRSGLWMDGWIVSCWKAGIQKLGMKGQRGKVRRALLLQLALVCYVDGLATV